MKTISALADEIADSIKVLREDPKRRDDLAVTLGLSAASADVERARKLMASAAKALKDLVDLPAVERKKAHRVPKHLQRIASNEDWATTDRSPAGQMREARRRRR